MLRLKFIMTALLFSSLALGLAAQDSLQARATGEQEISLRPKIYRDWKIRLPAEITKEIGTAIRFKEAMGHDFAAGLDGMTLNLDCDGDGALETQVKGEAGFVILTSGDRRYGLRIQASPKWVFAPGSTMMGEIEGTRIQLIDQNLNGRFDDFGEDAMVLGHTKTASFLSKVISLADGRLVELAVAADGQTLKYKPYVGAVAELDFSIQTQGKVLAAVIQSTDGNYSISLPSESQTVRLPPADYRFHSGLISLGGNRVTLSAGRSKAFRLSAEKPSSVKLGGPLQAEFAYVKEGEEFKFNPEQIWFYGEAGEEYSAWEPLGKSPKITITGKSGREIAEAYFPGSC